MATVSEKGNRVIYEKIIENSKNFEIREKSRKKRKILKFEKSSKNLEIREKLEKYRNSSKARKFQKVKFQMSYFIEYLYDIIFRYSLA